MSRQRARSRVDYAGWGTLLALRAALGCAPAESEASDSQSARLEVSPPSSAALSVLDDTQSAFSAPMPALAELERTHFFVGNSLFNRNWVAAPASVTSRDGLGPLFNARSCSGCHFKDGRGRPPEGDEPTRSVLVRVSAPGRSDHGAPRPHPHYGEQLQTEATGRLAAEATIRFTYEERTGAFADGTPYSLRIPRVRIDQRSESEHAADMLTSVRLAPQLVGLGLLEAVAESTLQALADPDDVDGDGISGRVNMVPSPALGRLAIGRFGWKAEQATLLDQTAAAFRGDMGITSTLFPVDDCTPQQTACRVQPSGGEPELDDRALASVASYLRTLALPAPRALPRAEREQARALFERARCSACHVPSLRTRADAEPAILRDRELAAFTDLLLHDMGPLLADDRPSYEASGREWRTPPLWGLGLVARVNGRPYFLHDGRARDLGEAILFHGGEAEGARAAFVAMDTGERSLLLRYLESL